MRAYLIYKTDKLVLFLAAVVPYNKVSQWVFPVLSLELLLLSIVSAAYAGVIGFFLKRAELAEQPLTMLELSALSLVGVGSVCAIVYCLNRQEKAKSQV